MDVLLPEMIDEAKLVDIQKAMAKDLRSAARKLKGKPAWFAVAQDVPLPDKTKVSLFVAVAKEAEAKAWQLKLKGMKPKLLAIGTCTLESKDGKNVEVGMAKVPGNRSAILKAARLAFKLDRAAKVSDPEVDDRDESDATASLSISPEIDAIVDKAPGDNAELLKLLKEYERLGLSEDQLKLALTETFG
jgi:hypothetical protein